MSPGLSPAKVLLGLGLLFLVLGLVFLLFERLGLPLGRLPGDIHIERERSSFHFPIVTSVVLSILATVVLNLFRR